MSLDFVALDVETANSNRGSICAIGLAVVRDGYIIDSVNWLTKPPEAVSRFEGRNISIHGIHEADVADQPDFGSRLADALALIGELPVVAHYASFDTGAIRDACGHSGLEWPSLDYACSMVMARRALQLPSYRLPIVCAELGVALDGHHNAEEDALAAARITLALAQKAGVDSLRSLADHLNVKLGTLRPRAWVGCTQAPATHRAVPRPRPELPTADPNADPHHPLFGHVIVFTGALSALHRDDARAAAAACGAQPERNVTGRTTLLVVGDGFAGNDPADFGTGKAAVASKWRAKGHSIEVLTEGDFLALLDQELGGVAGHV